MEDECSRNSHLQYVNSANRSPCDVIKKMADFQEDGDRKLQIFAYLHVGVTTLSITIGLYLWYCFIYRNKNFACQWHFNITLSWKYMNIHSSAHDVFVMLYLHALRSSCLLLRQEAGARSGLPAVGVRLPAVVDKLQVGVHGGVCCQCHMQARVCVSVCRSCM